MHDIGTQSRTKVLLVVAITLVIVVPVPAASQAVMVNARSLWRHAACNCSRALPLRWRASTMHTHVEGRITGIPMMQPDGIEIRCLSIKDVIEFAYAVPNEK